MLNLKIITALGFSFGVLSLGGCAMNYGCPLNKGQEGIGACSSVSSAFKASEKSTGKGFSVFDKKDGYQKAEQAKETGQMTPFSYNPLQKQASDGSKYVYRPAQIYRTWIAPYVDVKTQNLINAHTTYWVSKKGGWDVPISYTQGQASSVLSPMMSK